MPSRDFGHGNDTSAPQSGGSGGNRSLVLKLAGPRICGAPRVMVRWPAVLRGSALRGPHRARRDGVPRRLAPESLAEKELSDFSPLWFLRGLRFYEGATTCLGLKSPGLSICVTACVMQATRRMPNGACSFHCCLRHGEWDVRERWICARW